MHKIHKWQSPIWHDFMDEVALLEVSKIPKIHPGGFIDGLQIVL